MDSTHLLLAQALSMSGLLGASGAYAGMVRRRHDHRLEVEEASLASDAAIERVERELAMAHLENTFSKSVYRRFGRRFGGLVDSADRLDD